MLELLQLLIVKPWQLSVVAGVCHLVQRGLPYGRVGHLAVEQDDVGVQECAAVHALGAADRGVPEVLDIGLMGKGRGM